MTLMQRAASALWWAVTVPAVTVDLDSARWVVSYEMPALLTVAAVLGDGDQVHEITFLSVT